jgi:predicted MFS family arabinose efflux permease
MAGPVLTGHLGDRIGFGPALRLAFVVQAICIGWLAITDNTIVLSVSSVVVGAFVPGIVALVLGRVHELVPNDPRRQQAAWSLTTVAFALLGQASGAYGFSFLFERGGGYELLFALGAGALLLALSLDLAVTGLGRGGGKERADNS